MRALERVVAILEAVAEDRGALTPTAVAGRVGLSLSTVSRLMRQLADEGMLERNGGDSAYTLGARLIAIARAAVEPKELVEASLPEMRALRDACQETVSLHIRRGDHRICIAVVESPRPIRRVVPVGFSLPVHSGATGIALLAGLAPADAEEALRRAALPPRTLRSALRDVAAAREAGYCAASEAVTEGVSAVAAPIVDGEQSAASLSVAGPSYRLDDDAMARFAPIVVESAARITAALGHGRVR